MSGATDGGTGERDPDPSQRDATRPLRPADIPPGAGRGGTRRPFTDRDLPVAIAAGLLLVFLFLLTLFLHPAAFSLLVGALVVVGSVETARVCTERGVPVVAAVVVVAAAVMLVGAYRIGASGQAVGVVALFVGAVVWELADPERDDVFRRIAGTVMIGLWIPFLGSYGVLLVTREPDAWVAVLATIGVAVLSDVGAYVVGTRLGRRRLAPSISPGKTWEGVVGGVAVATVLAVAILPFLGSADLFGPVDAAVFAVVVAAAGVVGDLAESMVKRDLAVKDFGAIIPGHGGVLDRVDGILFALPTGYYTLALLGR